MSHQSQPRSSSASSQSRPNKRKASEGSIGPPPKVRKPPTALESRLIELQGVLNNIPPILYKKDDDFKAEMHRLAKYFNDFTPNMVQKYIEDGQNNADLEALKMVEDELENIQEDGTSTPSIGSRSMQRSESARRLMLTYLKRVRTCLEALVAQSQVKPPPREFADYKKWRIYQEKDNAILCLRPADKRGLPIPLMHSAFCTFTRHFHEPLLDRHTPKYITMADKLCKVMPSAFNSEPARRDAFEAIFQSFDETLEQHIEYSLSAPGSTKIQESGGRPDVTKTIFQGRLVLILQEFKLEQGDAYMQICRSFEVLSDQPKSKSLLKFGNPMFLLCVLGPNFMVCGAVKREQVHVEPLTTWIPMLPGFGVQGRPIQLAYCLQALKQGLDELRRFWQDIGIAKALDEKVTVDEFQEPQPGCPDNGLLRFDDWQGMFKSPMNDDRNLGKVPCFLATICKAGNDQQVPVVVKFVYNYTGTYGTAIHKHLHHHGLAPQLYSAKKLHSGLVMVVMGHLAFEGGIGGWVELDKFEGNLGIKADAVRRKLEEIVTLLQGQKMVHADLRPKNIMVKVDKNGDMVMSGDEPILSVIDFDWSGMVGDVRYPPFLNPKVPWPTGVEAYEEVGEEDDRILLHNWWDTFVRG